MKKMAYNGKQRVVIGRVDPEIDGGGVAIKRAVGEAVQVQADIFTEGHDEVAADLLFRKKDAVSWSRVPMEALGNDRWTATFHVNEEGLYEYTIEAWVNFFEVWQADLRKRYDAYQDLTVDLEIGVRFLSEHIKGKKNARAKAIRHHLKEIRQQAQTVDAARRAFDPDLLELARDLAEEETLVCYPRVLEVDVERRKALFSTWYELFPRSWGPDGKHGTFKDCERLLPEIERMGFDVLYLPPIHPIGATKRKGKNNTAVAEPGDVGSPWAIGSKDGGHKAIHPELGTLKDFQHFVKKAAEHGIEVALDLAYQCSPDHPYVKEHPQWFIWRPDGTIQHAENPPKKYEDVLPINFGTDDWAALWEELKSVVEHWIDQSVKIFRVDNPHTKPFLFWKWLIADIKERHPDVIFLAEAFTRPKVMNQLAKIGFTQSYTYFTWRTSQADFIEYMTELTQTEVRNYFRPNFWPNTPDILPFHLQTGGRPAFIQRLVLAATLSSNYGMYGPAFELCVHDPVPSREEYTFSEKYEIKDWDWDQKGHLKDFIAIINRIRRENPALQTTYNLRFCPVNNPNLLCFTKVTEDLSNRLLIVVNLDAHHTQPGQIQLALEDLGLGQDRPFHVRDLITNDVYHWQGEWNYVELNPFVVPAHIFRIESI